MKSLIIHSSYKERYESLLSSLGDGALDFARRGAWKTFQQQSAFAHKSKLKKSALLQILPSLNINSFLGCKHNDSIPKGVQVFPASALNQKGELPHKLEVAALSHLNEPPGGLLSSLCVALMDCGSILLVPKGVSCESFLKLDYSCSRKESCCSYRLIFVSEDACLNVSEESMPTAFCNSVVHFVLEPGARVNHYHMNDAIDNLSLHHLSVDLDQDASYKRYHLSLGSEACLREEVFASLRGQGSSADFYGVHSTSGARKSEHMIHVTHKASNTSSMQMYRGLLMDESRAMFQGAIVIDKDCKKVQGHQYSNSLLLSPHSRMYNEPALDIYSQDVSCSHGAAMGQIDKQLIFYLESRGISRDDAERIICEGFALEVLSKIPEVGIRQLFTNRFTGSLGG